MDRYQIIRGIAQSRQSSVYLAYDFNQRRLCAIANIREKNLDGSVEDLETLVGKRCKYLPEVYRVDRRRGGGVRIIQEYIYGVTLGSLLEDRREVALANKQRWFRQVKAALDFLHDQKPYPLLHGDLQPNNIMIDLWGEARLIDFSSLKREGAPQKRIHVTMEFASEKLFQGASYDKACDLDGLEKVFRML